MSYDLMLLATNGDKVTEHVESDVEDCWDRYNDLGSRWIFYPIPLVVTGSGLTIKDVGMDVFKEYVGKRVSTLQTFLKVHEQQVIEFINAVYN